MVWISVANETRLLSTFNIDGVTKNGTPVEIMRWQCNDNSIVRYLAANYRVKATNRNLRERPCFTRSLKRAADKYIPKIARNAICQLTIREET